MKIFFDHQTFTNQDFGGISRYFFELIKRFKNDIVDSCEVGLKYTNNAYLNKDTFDGLTPFFPDRTLYKKRKIMDLLNKQVCKKKLKKSNFDVFHPTYYDPYFLKVIGRKPFVVTFLDMIHEKLSDKYEGLKVDKNIFYQKKEMIENASKIIAISESTKNDIVDIFGVKPSNIEVVYLGNSLLKNLQNYDIISNIPYILFVGNRGMYKNFKLLVEASHNILIQNDIILTCAGGGDFNEEEKDFLQNIGLKDYVKFHKIDSDDILANLYTNAICFVFPSLYEGFGIPVLEAFACECPVVLSNGGSLPEIGGDAAIYFYPEDVNSIHSAIAKVINDSKLREDLRKKGTDRLKQFSWNETFSKTLNIYKSLI